jgi:hypothetical protein
VIDRRPATAAGRARRHHADAEGRPAPTPARPGPAASACALHCSAAQHSTLAARVRRHRRTHTHRLPSTHFARLARARQAAGRKRRVDVRDAEPNTIYGLPPLALSCAASGGAARGRVAWPCLHHRPQALDKLCVRGPFAIYLARIGWGIGPKQAYSSSVHPSLSLSLSLSSPCGGDEPSAAAVLVLFASHEQHPPGMPALFSSAARNRAAQTLM